MTKSSARKAATEKASGTDRKTARKAAAQFEGFARDAQMPESVRALAAKSELRPASPMSTPSKRY
jgi:hypothetical protein